MMRAEAYVFASPVYVEDINGVMKNWIDRMAFNSHRPTL
jgi:multimeric flavodoxin WrbA